MQKKKIESMQVLRALAFIGVVLSHCGFNDSTGAWGVSIFIVMSGFLSVYNHFDDYTLTKISVKENMSFSINKILKLYLLHILMTMVAVLQIIISWIRGLSDLTGELFAKLILNVFLLQSWIPNNQWYCSLNSVAWFLSTCGFLYFIFPYILKSLQLCEKRAEAIYASIFVFFLQVVVAWMSSKVTIGDISDNFERWITYILPLYRMGDFIIGCNLGYLFLTKKAKNFGKIQTTIAESIFIFLVMITNYIYANKISVGSEQWIRYNILFLPTTIGIVYLFALNNGIFSKLLTNRVSIYVGNRSGYAFLIHLMVISYMDVLVWHFFNISLSPIIKTIVVLLLTLLLTEIYVKIENVLKNKIRYNRFFR